MNSPCFVYSELLKTVRAVNIYNLNVAKDLNCNIYLFWALQILDYLFAAA